MAVELIDNWVVVISLVREALALLDVPETAAAADRLLEASAALTDTLDVSPADCGTQSSCITRLLFGRIIHADTFRFAYPEHFHACCSSGGGFILLFNDRQLRGL
jgi:hypothetical protein